jgi:tetratricopeptide (TPR) repeat protein
LLSGALAWGGAEAYGNLKASALVESLRTASTSDVGDLIEQIDPYRRWAKPRLLRLVNDSDPASRERLHASLALLPVDPGQADYLTTRLLAAPPADVSVLRSALRPLERSVAPRLWVVVAASRPDDPRLLAAAAALAVHDPQSDRWKQAGATLSDALVRVNAVSLGGWTELLRPVRHALAPRLASIFRDARRPETERALATNLLADYAGDDPELLAGLIMDAEPGSYAILLPLARRRPSQFLPYFQAELARQTTYRWHDPPHDPSWTRPDPAEISRIETALGMVDDGFAFCQTMPLDEFSRSAEIMRRAGYRPIRFRPYEDGQRLKVAAVWTRDGRNWRIASGLSREQVREQDDKNQHDNFLAVDVALYLAAGSGAKPAERYAAIWVEKTQPEDQVQIEVCADAEAHQAARNRFKALGMAPRTLQVARALDGRNRYTSVWQQSAFRNLPPDRPELDETSLALDLARNADSTLIDLDLDLVAAVPCPSTQERAAASLKAADAALKEQPNDPSPRLTRAIAGCQLGNYQQALDDLNLVIRRVPQAAVAFQYRALAHAALHHKQEALENLGRFLVGNGSEGAKFYLAVVVAAQLGEGLDQALEKLARALREQPRDASLHYDAACAYARASQALRAADPAASREHVGRAIELLRTAIRNGYCDYT